MVGMSVCALNRRLFNKICTRVSELRYDPDVEKVKYFVNITYYSDYFRRVIIEWIMNDNIKIDDIYMKRAATVKGKDTSRQCLYFSSNPTKK